MVSKLPLASYVKVVVFSSGVPTAEVTDVRRPLES